MSRRNLPNVIHSTNSTIHRMIPTLKPTPVCSLTSFPPPIPIFIFPLPNPHNNPPSTPISFPTPNPPLCRSRSFYRRLQPLSHPSPSPSPSPFPILLPLPPPPPLLQQRIPPFRQQPHLPLIHPRQPIPKTRARTRIKRPCPQRRPVEKRPHFDAELPEADGDTC